MLHCYKIFINTFISGIDANYKPAPINQGDQFFLYDETLLVNCKKHACRQYRQSIAEYVVRRDL